MSVINKKDLSTPPPVPPRRRKRRNELVLKTSSSKGIPAPESSGKSVHKLRLPPPPPPPLPPPPPPPTANSRGRKTPFVTNRRSHSITSHKPEADNVPTDCEDAATCKNSHDDETARSLPVDVSNSDPIQDQDDPCSTQDSTDSLELTRDNHVKEPEVRRGQPRCLNNKKTDNKYPSLFFTLQDFENVMADCQESVNDKIIGHNSQERSEVTFFGHSLDGDNQEEVCFRITTTNFPFEKCLGRWDSENFENKNFDADIQNLNHFVFEDYIDRTKRTGRIQQPESFLFADDTFENNDLDFVSTDRSATRVRFVVDSPSTSTPDGEMNEEEKVTDDSLLNIDSILADDFGNKDEPVTLTENADKQVGTEGNNFNGTVEFPRADEFGEIPFSSLLSTSGADVNNDLLAVKNDINLNCEVSSFNDIPESPESMHRVFTVTACIETLPNDTSKRIVETNQNIFPSINEIHVSDTARDDVRDDISMKKLNKKSLPQKDHIENGESVFHVNFQEPEYFRQDNKNILKELDVVTEKERIAISDVPQGGSKEIQIRIKDNLSLIKNNTPPVKLVEKRKIYIDESLHDLINNEEHMEWRDSSDEEEIDVKSGKIEFSTKQEIHPKEDYNKNMEKSSRPEGPKNIQKVECLSTTNNEITNENAENPTNKKIIPVSIRRNSFLEDMLKDDILQASCKIIATHPKIPPRPSLTPETPKEVKSTTRMTSQGISNDPRKKPGLERVKKEDKYPEVKSNEERKKSSCEVKSDVLSELLCNFSAIKLKSIGDNEAKSSVGIVDNKTKGLTTRSDSTPKDTKDPGVDSNNIESNVVKCKIVDEPIVDARSRDKSQDGDAASSEKTDELIDKSVNSSTRAKGPEVAVSTVDIETIDRIDECAIARKAPLTQCNNTDNNAMTPVAVSSDQFRDVSIAPGSVRSFVKYYEIQRETSKHSKSNDSEAVARPVATYRKQMEKIMKNEDCDQSKIERKKIVEDKARYNEATVSEDHDKNYNNQSASDTVTVNIDNDIRYTVITRKIVRRDANTLSLKSNSDSHRSAGNAIGKGSCFKMADPLKSECKKTVQFDSGCTVIQLSSYDYDEVLEDPNKVEWMRSEMTMIKEPVQTGPREAGSIAVQGGLFGSRAELEEETDRLTSRPVDGNSLRIEKSSGTKTEDDTRKSGIPRLVPKSTNHLSQTHVFYCTV